MGNIYYPSQAPMGAAKAPKPVFGALLRLTGDSTRAEPPPSTIDAATMEALFREPVSAVSLQASEVPLPHISWRAEAMHYEVAPGLTLFLPQSIHLTDGRMDYFIVRLGEVIEYRVWPSMRFPEKKAAQWTDHRPVTQLAERAAIEASLKAALHHLGIGQAMRVRFAHLKSRKLPLAAWRSLLGLLGMPDAAAQRTAERMRAAAADPVGFYESHAAALAGAGIRTPEHLAQEIFLLDMIEAERLMVLDTKAEPADFLHAVTRLCPGIVPPAANRREDILQALADAGWQLLRFASDADEACLLAVSAINLEACLALGKQCRLAITAW